MAFAFTVDGNKSVGSVRMIHGTFTSAAGDNTATLGTSVHGLDIINDYKFTLDTGAVGAQNPKVTIAAGGTLTAIFDNTQGYSGKWVVYGR